VVADVAGLLGEPTGDVQRWTKASANDAGLDVLCFRSFGDDRAATPVLLVQCASGKYEGKLHTPVIDLWMKIVNFTTRPNKAFATPFALTDAEFRQVAVLVKGMLLDRYRLLAPARTEANWLSPKLARDLVKWTAARVAKLPDGDA
jgi:hypothetical protein